MPVRHTRFFLNLLIAASVAAACIGARNAQAEARFCTSVSTFTFGNVAVGSTANAGVTVSNCGDQPFTFTDVSVHPQTAPAFHVSATCATGMTLAPAAACSATITFAPTAAGQVSGGLYLRNTTADADPLLTFYGRGVDAQAGTATLTFAPASAAFDPQVVGTQSPPLQVTLQNAGPDAMTFSNIVLTGPDAYDFDGLDGTCAPGTPVPAGQSCTMTLFFLPQAPGARAANLVFDSPQLASLAILQVEGTGINAGQARVTVVEYHDAALDHYFMTPLANEIALCDAQQPPCSGWVRTGYSFDAYPAAAPPAPGVGVCRFFNDSFAGGSSHFYALHGLGCEQTLALFPDWLLESSALFNATPPDAAGHCPAGSIPVWRLYNNGMGGAPNHRFTIDNGVRAQMIAAGWVPEGSGAGVGFCALQ